MADKTILLVDDEQNILRAFKRLFMDSEYNILLANCGKEALEIMEGQAVDLIISDMRMPLMDGSELLAAVKERYPHVIRAILSGFTEKEVMVRCIQNNLAVIYLLKPWDNDRLLLTISSILKLKQVLEENHIEEVTSSLIDKVTVRSNLCDEVLKQLELNAEPDKIAALIEEDFVLSAIILHFVNSAFCGNNIASVGQAMKYLSPKELRDIILSKKTNEAVSIDVKYSNLKDILRKQAALKNKINHFIYKEIIGKEIPEEYRLAGLLSNIGILIFLKMYENEYVNLVHKAIEKDIHLIELEKESYGISHQEAGGYLLNWWGIPFALAETAIYHHDPQNPDIINKELINVTYVSTYYTYILTGFKPPEECSRTIFSSIGTTKDECDRKIFSNYHIQDLKSNIFGIF